MTDLLSKDTAIAVLVALAILGSVRFMTGKNAGV